MNTELLTRMPSSPAETRLLEFVNSHYHPRYALLLNGKWGSGKTKLINDVMASLKKEKRPVAYVSLNGINSVDDISSLMYSELHPKLGGKVSKISRSLFYSLIKNGIKIDLNDAIQVGSGISEGIFSRKPENEKDFVAIFDDLERCKLPIEESLGYINRFVENEYVRVIIVANEQEISHGKYFDIKEKVVGETVNCVPNFKSAFSWFANEIQAVEFKSMILSQFHIFEQVFTESQSENLRIVRHAVMKWNSFVMRFGLVGEKQAADILCPAFVSISTEHFKNKESIHILENMNRLKAERLLNKSILTADAMYENPFEKYECFKSKGLILPYELWVKYFDGENIERDVVYKALKDSNYLGNKESPLWYRAWDHLNCKSSDFEKLVNDIRFYLFDELNPVLGIYLHCVGTAFSLIRCNLFPLEKESFIEKVNSRISSFKYSMNMSDSSFLYRTEDASFGHVYNSSDDADFFKIRVSISAISNIQKRNNDAQNLLNLSSDLNENFDAFINELPKARIIPYAAITRMAEYLGSVPIDFGREFWHAFKSRYAPESSKKYEFHILRKIIIEFTKKSRKLQHIDAYRMGEFYVKWFSEALDSDYSSYSSRRSKMNKRLHKKKYIQTRLIRIKYRRASM